MEKSSQALLKDLNPAQSEAVEATDGPVLVLAGAGSGKTRVLTYRIAHLIDAKGISPREILAMTFTNKAAGEMRERVREFVKDEGLWIGTFHSLFARMLRLEAGRFGYSSNFVIYDTDDQQRLIKAIMKDLRVSPQQFSPKSILGTISRAKNSLVAPDSFNRMVSGPFEELVALVYPEYQNRLRENHAFDFDDLITVPIILFRQYPEVLEKYQSRFLYILVDEYQDTNRAQYELVHLLAGAHQNLCVVGDDDQSIYSWRGADIRNILEFEKDFPEARVFRLEQNYRSTQNILAAASAVVEHNVSRKGKRLWTEQEPGEKVTVMEVTDERDEAQQIVLKIQNEVFSKKRSFQDFAVLYRTNAQSRSLEDGLRKNGIAYIIVGGVRFYERKEIKDVLAYLKLITNPRDSISLMRIINFPVRGIGDTTLGRVAAWAQEKRMHIFEALSHVDELPELQNRACQSLKGFTSLIQRYMALKDEISPNELVHALVDEVGLLSMYKEDTSIEAQTRTENIRELLAAVQEYVSRTDEPTLSGFLEEVSLVADVDGWDDRSNAVTLMTLHCAKGLEFPVVFIAGLEEGLLPVFQNIDDAQGLEEERRLFYVGLTRAQEKAYVSWAQTRSRFSDKNFCFPSRFLEELDQSVVETIRSSTRGLARYVDRPRGHIEQRADDHPDYESYSQEVVSLQPGLHVEHEVYGKGCIVRVDGGGAKQKVTVLFDGGVEKKFLSHYAKFTLL